MSTPTIEVAGTVHVIGASGRSGVALCRSLLADGVPALAIVRDEAKWRALDLRCPFRVADFEDPGSIEAALANAENVVSCAHARHIPVILEAASRAKRFVFLGSTRKFTRWPDDHGRGVLAGEASFLASGRAGVILHPTMIYGATGENNVSRLAKLLRRLPIVPLPNGGKALVQPIYQDDVTRAVRASLEIAWDGPHTMVIGGPEPVRYADFVREVAIAAGIKGVRIVSVPLAPLMAGAWVLGFLPFLPKVRPAELRRLCEDKDFDISQMREVLGVRPTGLTEGLAKTLTPSQTRPARIEANAGAPVLRILDVVLAGVGLIVTAPVLLVCVILIRSTTKGPGIFRQERVGIDRRPFVCLKLRTMRRDTPSAASHDIGHWATTPIGRVLRKTKLDELPQLWNVLRGEMSLVGPRPCLPIQTALIEERERLGVYRVRPGVTGPAQILGIDMSQPSRLAQADATWLKDRSVVSYLKAVLFTALGKGRGDPADRRQP